MEIKIIDCPRDAMQGFEHFIPTENKINYLNLLLRVGFHTLDFGSFVSPKAIPQLADTARVLDNLDLENTRTKLLAIVANAKGAEIACKYNSISYIGFPFSVSETFQQRNTNSSIEESLKTVEYMQNLCVHNGKELVVYISMGFGNPYGDAWNVEVVEKWVKKLQALGVKILSLSDTIGVATPEDIDYLFKNLISAYPEIEFGAHFHTVPVHWREKVDAAYKSGCRRFDGALKGFGGCPMAKDELTGNMPTEKLISYFEESGMNLNLDKTCLEKALVMTSEIFEGKY